MLFFFRPNGRMPIFDEPIDNSEPVVEQSVNIHELPDVSFAMFSIHMLIFIVFILFLWFILQKGIDTTVLHYDLFNSLYRALNLLVQHNPCLWRHIHSF